MVFNLTVADKVFLDLAGSKKAPELVLSVKETMSNGETLWTKTRLTVGECRLLMNVLESVVDQADMEE